MERGRQQDRPYASRGYSNRNNSPNRNNNRSNSNTRNNNNQQNTHKPLPEEIKGAGCIIVGPATVMSRLVEVQNK